MNMKAKKSDIKVTYTYEPISKEEEEWRLKRLFELLLKADMRSLEKLKKEEFEADKPQTKSNSWFPTFFLYNQYTYRYSPVFEGILGRNVKPSLADAGEGFFIYYG